MASLVNNCVFNATSAGTGVFVVNTVVTGYQLPAAVGVVDTTKTYRYRAQSSDLTQWEEGDTVSSSTQTSFTRVVTASSAGGTTTVSFTNPPQVALTMEAADVLAFDDAMSLTAAQKVQAQTNIGVREILTASRTYYVLTTGSDSNTGLVNTAGGAFLTIQKAIDTAAGLDSVIYDVTISVGAGTYTLATTLAAKNTVGSGSVIIIGDETTPANVVINCSTAATDVVTFDHLSTTYHMRGVKITNTSATGVVYGLYVTKGSSVKAQNIALGAGLLQAIRIDDQSIFTGTGGTIYLTASMTSGGAGCAFGVTDGMCRIQSTASINIAAGLTIDNFINSGQGGQMLMNGPTFAGSSFTGARYSLANGAVLNTGGQPTTWIPGSAVGTGTTLGTAPYGLYI